MSNLWCLARNAASSFEHHEHQAARRRSCWVRPAAGARELPDLRCGTAPCLGGIRDVGTLLRLQAAVPGRPWAAGQGSAGRTGSGLLTTVVSHNLGRRTRSFRKQEQRAQHGPAQRAASPGLPPEQAQPNPTPPPHGSAHAATPPNANGPHSATLNRTHAPEVNPHIRACAPPPSHRTPLRSDQNPPFM